VNDHENPEMSTEPKKDEVILLLRVIRVIQQQAEFVIEDT
jgi:hypothetical protein